MRTVRPGTSCEAQVKVRFLPRVLFELVSVQEEVQKSLPREVEVRQRHGRMTTGKNPTFYGGGSRVWSSLDQPTSFANFKLGHSKVK